MIVVLEGLNGVGKTTYARALAETFGAPILRAFRPSIDHHHTGASETEQHLRSLGVPVNTHVDDMYVADILAQLRPSNVILDRSLPSAHVYGSTPTHLVYRGFRPDGSPGLFDIWQDKLRSAGEVIYVWLRAPHAVASTRSPDRVPSMGRYAAMESWFRYAYESWDGHKLPIDTSEVDVEEGVDDIVAVAAMRNAKRLLEKCPT